MITDDILKNLFVSRGFEIFSNTLIPPRQAHCAPDTYAMIYNMVDELNRYKEIVDKQAKVIEAAKDVVFYYGGDKLSPIQNLKQALKELEG